MSGTTCVMKARYFIDDEMVWAYAKDAMRADLDKREGELNYLRNQYEHRKEQAIYSELELEALQFYIDHMRNEYELRQQTYEKFLQWYEDTNPWNKALKEMAEEADDAQI